MNAAQSDNAVLQGELQGKAQGDLIKLILELSMRMTRDWITWSFISSSINVPCNLMSSDFDCPH